MCWPFEGGAHQQKVFASFFQERRKAFFSEEKKQKTFVHWLSVTTEKFPDRRVPGLPESVGGWRCCRSVLVRRALAWA
jgi:hypothetical protein